MTTTKTTTLLPALALAVLAAPLAGCVPNEKYEALRIRTEGLEAQAQQAQADADAAEARAAALEGQLDNTAGGQSGLQGMLAQERDRNERLRGDYDDLRAAYDSAIAGGGADLPAPVVTDLNRFAAQNPGLVQFDQDTGVVRFTSDLTFGSGSANLKDGAGDAIGRFAQILTGDQTRDYELMVAGHTDNVPVSNPATARAHPNNWYLSSHRAITVAEALRSAGVEKSRLGVAGYADQRPVADNATADGRAQNRRVEVMILPAVAPATVEPLSPADPTQVDDQGGGGGAAAEIESSVEFEEPQK